MDNVKELGTCAVPGRAWQIWQQDFRTAGNIFGSIMLAFGLVLFLLLTPSGMAQAHERDLGTPPCVSLANAVSSIADCKSERATTLTFLSASASDDSGCHGGAVHANCSPCTGGHCFSCSAVVLAATLDISFAPEPYAPAFPGQSGLALSKPDAAFRPPRSVL